MKGLISKDEVIEYIEKWSYEDGCIINSRPLIRFIKGKAESKKSCSVCKYLDNFGYCSHEKTSTSWSGFEPDSDFYCKYWEGNSYEISS
jgi:hypothetical protein